MHFSRTILCVLGFVSTAAAEGDCEPSVEDGIAILTAVLVKLTELPEKCLTVVDPDAECAEAVIKKTNEACDSIDGLTSRNWVVEKTCDGKTETTDGAPVCTPIECSAEDYQKSLLDDVFTDDGESCDGILSVTVKSSASTFSRMNIIGGVGVILSGVVALM